MVLVRTFNAGYVIIQQMRFAVAADAFTVNAGSALAFNIVAGVSLNNAGMIFTADFSCRTIIIYHTFDAFPGRLVADIRFALTSNAAVGTGSLNALTPVPNFSFRTFTRIAYTFLAAAAVVLVRTFNAFSRTAVAYQTLTRTDCLVIRTDLFPASVAGGIDRITAGAAADLKQFAVATLAALGFIRTKT